MSKIKRQDKQLAVSDKVNRGKDMVSKCTGNPLIASLTTELADFTAANSGLENIMHQVAGAQASLSNLVLLQSTADATWNAKARCCTWGSN